MKLTVVLVLVAVDVLHGEKWASYDFPDPRVDHEACGLSAPGWVCDPENILSTGEIESLNAEIEAMQAELGACVRSVCGSKCNATEYPAGKYLPAVAVVPELHGTHRSDDEKLSATEDFAKSLRVWNWNYGSSCTNDLVLALAVKERKVWTSAGEAVIGAGLTSRCLTKVFEDHRQDFSDGDYGEGLLSMVKYFRRVLNGSEPCSSDSGATESQITESGPGLFELLTMVDGRREWGS